jgi:hypothetical protein
MTCTKLYIKILNSILILLPFLRCRAEITNLMQSDEGRERLLEGVVASHRLLVGTLVGWGSGLLLRRFGRSLVTSVGGGSLLILVAHKRGYVTLKWSRILEDLGGHADDADDVNSTTTGHSEEEGQERRAALLEWWRVLSVREWIQGHSLSLAGFICGFLYNFFT